MIYLYCWNTGQNACLRLDASLLHTQREQLLKTSDVLWIDLEDPTPDEEYLIFKEFYPIHPLSLEDITRMKRDKAGEPHFPKVEEFRDCLFIIVNPLAQRVTRSPATKTARIASATMHATTQLSAVITKKILITHHYEPLPSIEECRMFVSRHEERFSRGPDYLFHVVLDAMVDQYAALLDHFDDALDEFEVEVLEKPSGQLLSKLHKLKRSIITMRKTLVYEREILARLARGEFTLIDEREMVYYRNVYDHLVRFTELIESSREMSSDLLQTHLSAMSNKLNEIMKVLAMISTMILPMTLIAGIYGMNFEEYVFPHYKSNVGFTIAIALMVITGVVSFVYFKWRKWV